MQVWAKGCVFCLTCPCQLLLWVYVQRDHRSGSAEKKALCMNKTAVPLRCHVSELAMFPLQLCLYPLLLERNTFQVRREKADIPPDTR